MAIRNSGQRSSVTRERKMLSALSFDPQRASALAAKAGLTESEALDV